MAETADPWLAAISRSLHKPLRRAADGLATNVALMHLLAECASPDEAEAALDAAADALIRSEEPAKAERIAACLALLRASPEAFQTVHAILGGLDHSRAPSADAVSYWASAFNRAVRTNPEASVALYALGDAALLDAATAEVLDLLSRRGLITPRTACLDIGCGIGRFEVALGPRVKRIVGIDIAAAMVEEARRRTAGLANVEIELASGCDLAGFADGSFDLVLAVDAFPYIVAAGVAEVMIGEAGRVLRPGGRLILLNYSYRDDLEGDRSELRALAAPAGLVVRRDGTAVFSVWDGTAFELEKA